MYHIIAWGDTVQETKEIDDAVSPVVGLFCNARDNHTSGGQYKHYISKRNKLDPHHFSDRYSTIKKLIDASLVSLWTVE